MKEEEQIFLKYKTIIMVSVKGGEKMNSEQNFYEVDELHKIMGGPRKIAKGTIYAAIKKGDIPAVKVGRRALIPRWFVEHITNGPKE